MCENCGCGEHHSHSDVKTYNTDEECKGHRHDGCECEGHGESGHHHPHGENKCCDESEKKRCCCEGQDD